MNDDQNGCYYCGRNSASAVRFLRGPSVSICASCVLDAVAALVDDLRVQPPASPKPTHPDCGFCAHPVSLSAALFGDRCLCSECASSALRILLDEAGQWPRYVHVSDPADPLHHLSRRPQRGDPPR
jgi:hypothetical protein